MKLPKQLQQAIEDELDSYKLNQIAAAREELTEKYRQPRSAQQNFMQTDAHRMAYIASRMPATYGAIARVLQTLPNLSVKTLLDLGAGPGTAMWAACELFPGIEKITLIEKDPHLISIGKKFAVKSPHTSMQKADWQLQDLKNLNINSNYDLIILSYSIGELPAAFFQSLLEKCWNATNQYLAVIEPGTPAGFERIRTIREYLIGFGSYMAAPCPHTLACPMSGGNWCHFSERIERSSFHRRIKGGDLGYEDEKFSYVAVSKTPCELPQARILRHPIKRSGHVILSLCTAAEGLQQKTVSKRTPEAYRYARNAEWGDVWK